jgi:hypothetical protein
LGEEYRLKVSDNRVLRRIFGATRDEVTGGWSKLYNKKRYYLQSSLSIMRMIRLWRMGWAEQGM